MGIRVNAHTGRLSWPYFALRDPVARLPALKAALEELLEGRRLDASLERSEVSGAPVRRRGGVGCDCNEKLPCSRINESWLGHIHGSLALSPSLPLSLSLSLSLALVVSSLASPFYEYTQMVRLPRGKTRVKC